MSRVGIYTIKFQRWDRSWCLLGPVGANRKLLFGSARSGRQSCSMVAKAKGGTIKVHDDRGKLFKIIEVEAKVSGGAAYVLPSV